MIGTGESSSSTSLNKNVLNLGVSHLQLEKRVLTALSKIEVHTIGDAVKLAAANGAPRELEDSLTQLAAVTLNGEINWVEYWICCRDTPQRKFHSLAATCVELDCLGDAELGMPVSKGNFGNAGSMLALAGIDTLRELRTNLTNGISGVQGLGQKKINEFFSYLIRFVEGVDKGGRVRDRALWGQTTVNEHMHLSKKFSLPEGLEGLPIGILKIGIKEEKFFAEGIRKLGDLAEVWPIKYPNKYGFGPGTLEKLNENVALLLGAASDNHSVDWTSYAEGIGAALIPNGPPASSAESFLRSIPDVLREVACSLEDPVLQDILLNRLAQLPQRQKTLEEIGAAASPTLTRERIRQKEKKLLKQLAGGLLWDEYGSLALMFRSEFCEWWRVAATHFEGQREIGFPKFISGLSTVWNVDESYVMDQLSFILAIVTGEVRMPLEFRSAGRLNSFFYSKLSGKAGLIRLSALRLKKVPVLLAGDGYEVLADVIKGCRTGKFFEKNIYADRVVNHLNNVQHCFFQSGDLNWTSYSEALKLPVVPTCFRKTANDFASCLAEDLAEIIENVQVSGRAKDIFHLRTRLPPDQRLTLAQVATQLDTHGPSIKREETLLLENLNELIIEKNFSNSRFWLCNKFLYWWGEAEAASSLAEGDYGNFCDLLQDFLCLSEKEVRAAAPAIWAVIHGYPNGRPRISRKRRRKEDSAASSAATSQSMGRIRLSGFRRVH